MQILQGDYGKGKKLRWKPSILFEDLIKMVMEVEFIKEMNILKK